MKTSIYISAEQIQAIGYSGSSVRKFVAYPLPEGTIYNGRITDSVFLSECLTSMKREHPELFKSGVTLVADGSSILSRRITAPKLGKKHYLQLVRDDFADSIDNPDNLVCGYHKLEHSGNSILACAVGNDQVDSYIDTFKAAGVKLEAIHVGVEVILSYVKSRPELHNMSIVINVIDGPTMLSMLFENGNNIFMTRTRLYGDDKEQVFQHVLENLNGLIQFARSQNIGEITRSYYLGVSEANIKLLEALNPYTDIQIGTLAIYKGPVNIPPDAHFASLNMLHGSGGIDLVAARKDLEKYIKLKGPRKTWIPLLALYIVVLAAPAIYLWLEIDTVSKGINELNNYINSPAVVRKQEELAALRAETAFYNDAVRQVDEKAEWEDSIPKATSRMMDLIVSSHGVEVTVMNFEFNENTGVVRVTANCADASVSADYVDALYDSGVAQNVHYQGYGSSSGGMFTFTVDITLNVRGAK